MRVNQNRNLKLPIERKLAKQLVATCLAKGLSLSVAESLTGGLLSSSIVGAGGASKIFKAGLVTYTNEMKSSLLGVNAGALKSYGAVSAQVAQEMAEKVCLVTGSDVGIGTTGLAGPKSAEGKPVGLAYVGVSTPIGVSVYVRHFSGGRQEIRTRVTVLALRRALRLIQQLP